MVVKQELELEVDPKFHPDSYGYRPRKSALEAIGKARERCWKYDWVIDVDIKGFFDELNHKRLMEMVLRHTEKKWVKLYIERWLTGKIVTTEGLEIRRAKGTPQGGVISPLLANIYLHHTFDEWMAEKFETLPFERYADDIVVHCQTQKQAKYVLDQIRNRLREAGLELNPEKTKVVYCKDQKRTGEYEQTKFDFLGYEYRGRSVVNKQTQAMFVGFTPALSPKARKHMGDVIRSWKLSKNTTLTLEEVANKINPVVRGWIRYYGVYAPSNLRLILRQIEFAIARWAMRKFKFFHRHWVRTLNWLSKTAQTNPKLFVHWSVQFS